MDFFYAPEIKQQHPASWENNIKYKSRKFHIYLGTYLKGRLIYPYKALGGEGRVTTKKTLDQNF